MPKLTPLVKPLTQRNHSFCQAFISMLEQASLVGVPLQTPLNQWAEVRAKVYAACGA
jgi:hypothetical protein